MIKSYFLRFKIRRELRRQMTSEWLRMHYASAHHVHVGMYSYGCFDIKRFPRETQIGRYCSFAQTCTLLNANHVLSYLSTHPYLYNTALGMVESEPFERTRFLIGDDVWIGHNAVLTAKARSVGRGAVVAAGAVVTKPVPAYAIVAGTPAKIIGYRFAPEVIERIEESQWWNMTQEQLRDTLKSRPEMLLSPAQYFGGSA